MPLRSLARLLVTGGAVFSLVSAAACGSGDDGGTPGAPAPTTNQGSATTPPPADTSPAPAVTPTPPADDPGPPPAGCPDIKKDSDGFFTRTTAAGHTYVGFVPKSYSGSPSRLVVGMHGCGDDAHNFATWGVCPDDTRDTQDWIGISVEGANGSGGCFAPVKDEQLVFDAIADISSCFYVHQQKIVLAGYSAGGDLGYSIAMRHADKFAGLLIECSSISSAGSTPAALIAGAARKIPIAHRAHNQDQVYKLTTVQKDWATLQAAGWPITTSTVDGTHDGTSDDWAQWLMPQMNDGEASAWKLP